MIIQRLLLVCVFLSFFVLEASACSCVGMSSSDAFKAADAVFVGSVTKFEVQGNPEESDFDNRKVLAYRKGRKATFRLNKVWKGPRQETMTIFTGEGGGDCGFDFIVGHEYLVYTFQKDGWWTTGICTRTRDVWFSDWSDASEDFHFLESINESNQ